VLADAVEPFALSALKYGLFALLFLFLWRSMRWVVRGLNVDRSPAAPMPGPGARAGSDRSASQPVPANVLVHVEGKEKPRALRLAANTVIGRAMGCELRLEDTYVSQEHARIFAKNGSWYVEDLGSTNGTKLNGQQVQSRPLSDGDRITVGTTVIEYRRV
jgi:hypothetical protein